MNKHLKTLCVIGTVFLILSIPFSLSLFFGVVVWEVTLFLALVVYGYFMVYLIVNV